ncbi:MAG: Fic family protein [bacterium]|nr:Fic family protein [bacterium]
MMKEKKIFQPLTSKNVCQIYELLVKHELVSFTITPDGISKVEALVANITNAYFGEEIYKSTEEKVVAYLYFLIKDHPFIDGNKRTACLTFEVACAVNDLSPNYKGLGLDSLAVFIEKIQEPNHHETIKSLVRILFHIT